MSNSEDELGTLNLFKYSMLIAGTWPTHLIKSRRQQLLYRLLSFINTYFFLFFMVTMYIELPIAIRDGNLLENVSLSIIYTMSLFKVHICKSEKIRKLLYVLLDSEKTMRKSQDKEMKNIFMGYVKKRNLTSKVFLYLCTCVCTSFIITHYFELVYSWDGITHINGTTVRRKLPYVSYFPLDRNKYYTCGFVFHGIIAIQAGFFYVVAQLFVLTFEVHVCYRLECLQHVLRNIKLYSNKILGKFKSEEESLQATLYLCVEEHQNIMRFLTNLNQSLKMLMLLDFTTSSFQLASLLISIIMNDLNPTLYFGLVCFTMMLFQIVALYYFANEIKIQSFAISLATYDIQWYTCSKSLSQRLHIMIMRSQKPLALYIGPFGEMSLEKAVSIIKTAYSFTAFMYR